MDDLGRVFGEFCRGIPEGPPGAVEFTVTPEVVPAPPGTLSTDRIFIRKTYHGYNCWYRADRLQLFGQPQALRQLGAFLISCVFHDPERATLRLKPGSDVRTLVYRRRPNREHPDMSLRLECLRYSPELRQKHPWAREKESSELPLLALSTEDELVYTDEDWTRRDTVFVESSRCGTLRLAVLLLDAGCSSNLVSEFELEGDAGFRGVAPLSAELQIVLPGSPLWVDEAQILPQGAAATGG